MLKEGNEKTFIYRFLYIVSSLAYLYYYLSEKFCQRKTQVKTWEGEKNEKQLCFTYQGLSDTSEQFRLVLPIRPCLFCAS